MAAASAKVRMGLIGAGNIGREHVRNLALLKDVCELVCVADDHEPSRTEVREMLDKLDMGGCRVIEGSDALLESADVQAVIIATPNFHHIEAIRKAATSGKALLIEKPLCTTVEDCLEAAKLSELDNLIWWVGMEYRYIPSIERLIREVTSGTIGNLRMLSIREHRFPFLTKVNSWNRFNVFTGGTLVEKCCHFFDLMLHIVEAPPVSVFGSGSQDVNHLGEDYDGQTPDILDNAYVVVDFANGVRACLDLCMFAEASRNQEEIIAVGDAGKLEAFAPSHGATTSDESKPNFVIGKRASESMEPDLNSAAAREPPAPPGVSEMHISIDPTLMEAGHHCGATYVELRSFCEAIQNGTAVHVTVADGLRAVALGIAAQKSIAEKRVVQISELGLDEYFVNMGEIASRDNSRQRQVSGAAKSEPALPTSSFRRSTSAPAMAPKLDDDGFGLMFYPRSRIARERGRSASPDLLSPKAKASSAMPLSKSSGAIVESRGRGSTDSSG